MPTSSTMASWELTTVSTSSGRPVWALMADLRKRNIVTKVRTKMGQTVGGIPFTRGSLAHLLRNRFYVGEVEFKGEVLNGEQPAILDRDLFDAVRAKLNEQANNHKAIRTKSEALLTGRVFDDRGNRMSPSHARKSGVKYRYLSVGFPPPRRNRTRRVSASRTGIRNRGAGHQRGSRTSQTAPGDRRPESPSILTSHKSRSNQNS